MYTRAMRLDTYRMVLAVCLFILVAGGTAHTFFGFEAGGSDRLGVDDAYISYRYARNLSRGNGLVFNPGERVEGYSNFSYTLLMSLACFFTQGTGVYYVSAFLNLLFACTAFFVFAGFLRQRLGSGLAAVGGLLFVLCLPVWAAVATGLETCLVLLLYIAIWVTAERLVRDGDGQRTAVLCALNVLTLLSRADGFLMPGAAIAYLLLKRRLRAGLACAATLGLTGFAYELWRYHYYGSLLPSTYYIRVTGPFLWRAVPAFYQLIDIALYGGLLPYLVVFLVLVVDIARRWLRNQRLDLELISFDLLLASGWIAYWFFVGGDYIGDRFLLILFPLGIFGLLNYLRGDSSTHAVALLVILVAVLEILPARRTDRRFHYARSRYDCGIAAGKFLQEHYPGKSLATSALGKIPFFLDSYTIDMEGLIEPVIAHGPPAQREFEVGHVKFNADYTLSKRCDLIFAEINGPSLNLEYGLDRQEYEAAGYRLGYLLYSGRQELGEPIASVQGMREDAIDGLIQKGYDYAILVKK